MLFYFWFIIAFPSALPTHIFDTPSLSHTRRRARSHTHAFQTQHTKELLFVVSRFATVCAQRLPTSVTERRIFLWIIYLYVHCFCYKSSASLLLLSCWNDICMRSIFQIEMRCVQKRGAFRSVRVEKSWESLKICPAIRWAYFLGFRFIRWKNRVWYIQFGRFNSPRDCAKMKRLPNRFSLLSDSDSAALIPSDCLQTNNFICCAHLDDENKFWNSFSKLMAFHTHSINESNACFYSVIMTLACVNDAKFARRKGEKRMWKLLRRRCEYCDGHQTELDILQLLGNYKHFLWQPRPKHTHTLLACHPSAEWNCVCGNNLLWIVHDNMTKQCKTKSLSLVAKNVCFAFVNIICWGQVESGCVAVRESKSDQGSRQNGYKVSSLREWQNEEHRDYTSHRLNRSGDALWQRHWARQKCEWTTKCTYY